MGAMGGLVVGVLGPNIPDGHRSRGAMNNVVSTVSGQMMMEEEVVLLPKLLEETGKNNQPNDHKGGGLAEGEERRGATDDGGDSTLLSTSMQLSLAERTTMMATLTAGVVHPWVGHKTRKCNILRVFDV